jgi:hypothetical protein
MADRTEAYKIVSCRAQVGINKSQKINVFTGLITLNNNSLPSPPGIYIYIYMPGGDGKYFKIYDRTRKKKYRA